MEQEPGATWLVVRILVEGTSHVSSHPLLLPKIVSSFTSKWEVREFESDGFFSPLWGKAVFQPIPKDGEHNAAEDTGVSRSLPLKPASQQTQMHAV